MLPASLTPSYCPIITLQMKNSISWTSNYKAVVCSAQWKINTVKLWNSECYLHDFGVDLVELRAAATLATHFLVLSVLLAQRIKELHDLWLRKELIVHGRPSCSSPTTTSTSSALGAIKPPLLQLRQQLMT